MAAYVNIGEGLTNDTPCRVQPIGQQHFRRDRLSYALTFQMLPSTIDSGFEGFSSGVNIIEKLGKRWERISFGVESLDRLTSGGIPMRGIVELAGEAGTGKTQLALKLALQTIRKSSQSVVLFINTEHSFPSGRLVQMVQSQKRQEKVKDEHLDDRSFLDHILVEHLTTLPALMHSLLKKLPVLLETTPVSLLVIDSITGPFQEEQNFVARAESYRSIVHSIQILQERYHFATLVTNQVRSVIDSSTLDAEQLVPALGLSWSTLVHTRLQLSRVPNSSYRRCTVTFGPTLPIRQAFYEIDASGPCDIVR